MMVIITDTKSWQKLPGWRHLKLSTRHLQEQSPHRMNHTAGNKTHKSNWPRGPSGSCSDLRVVEVVSQSSSSEFGQCMLFALQAATEERRAAQVDEYLTPSRQTGSTFKRPTSINCQDINTHTRSHITHPAANTPWLPHARSSYACKHKHTPPEARTHLQSLTCFSSDVNIVSHVNTEHICSLSTHTHSWIYVCMCMCMCSKPRIKLRTLTFRNRDRAKQTWNKHSPK